MEKKINITLTPREVDYIFVALIKCAKGEPKEKHSKNINELAEKIRGKELDLKRKSLKLKTPNGTSFAG